jgi:hypothetical protein
LGRTDPDKPNLERLSIVTRDKIGRSAVPGPLVQAAACGIYWAGAWQAGRGRKMEMTIGGCMCGAVRYRTSAEPIITRLCWCRVCQHIAAGNAAVNVCFPSAGMTVVGETRDFVRIADSGNTMHRRFCPLCGTHLFSEAESRPHVIFVRAGTLDDREIARPSAAIWTRSAPSWACIDAALPQFEAQSPVPASR